MSYTGYLNVATLGQSFIGPTNDSAPQPNAGGPFPINNQTVTPTLSIENTGPTVTIQDIYPGQPLGYGQIAETLRSQLRGATVGATGVTNLTFNLNYSVSQGVNPPMYGILLHLLMSDGTGITVAPMPGTLSASCSGVTFGNQLNVFGQLFTATSSTLATGGNLAPLFSLGNTGTAGTGTTGAAVNLAAAINKWFLGTATPTTYAATVSGATVTVSQPYAAMVDLSGNMPVSAPATTLTVGGTPAAGDQIQLISHITGPTGPGLAGQPVQVTFTATTSASATGGALAPLFQATGTTGTAQSLATAIAAIFGAGAATSSGPTITFENANSGYGFTGTCFGLEVTPATGSTGTYTAAAGANAVAPQSPLWLPQTAQ